MFALLRNWFTCWYVYLAQVLIEKGVSVNEIKLYGEPESDDALDDLSTKDSFSELEAVMSKVGNLIYNVHFH